MRRRGRGIHHIHPGVSRIGSRSLVPLSNPLVFDFQNRQLYTIPRDSLYLARFPLISTACVNLSTGTTPCNRRADHYFSNGAGWLRNCGKNPLDPSNQGVISLLLLDAIDRLPGAEALLEGTRSRLGTNAESLLGRHGHTPCTPRERFARNSAHGPHEIRECMISGKMP